MNTNSPTPAAPQYVRFQWVTGRLGVQQQHRLQVDFRQSSAEPDTYVKMTQTKATGEFPVWFKATAYRGAANDDARAALRDAVTGSGLLGTTPTTELREPARGELQVILGTDEGGIQPAWIGQLDRLSPQMQQAFEAGKAFTRDALVEREFGPGDVVTPSAG